MWCKAVMGLVRVNVGSVRPGVVAPSSIPKSGAACSQAPSTSDGFTICSWIRTAIALAVGEFSLILAFPANLGA